MKTMTRITPTMLATAPAWIESAPSSAPTVRSSRIVIGAGSAPARSRSARSLADCTVKLPEMMPLPPRIGSRMTGALITLLSSTMAKGLPIFSRVVHGHAAVDQLECQLGGASQQVLDVLRVIDPGERDQDAVLALALDRRLLGAGLVDAAANDLDRLFDGLAAAGFGRHRAELHL